MRWRKKVPFLVMVAVSMSGVGSGATARSVSSRPPVIDVKRFGARGDGVTDDTAAVQRAIDSAHVGDTVFFPGGVYLVTSVGLRPGLQYSGERATIKRPPGQSKFTRTFTTNKPGYLYSSDEDSPPLVIQGLTFDGSRDQQGPYSDYQLEQAHLLFLMADPSRKGRLRVRIQHCSFRDCVADGISVYTNVDVQVLDCSSRNCFRGGFVLTGGYTRAVVRDFTSRGTVRSRGVAIEVDGKGYGDTYRVDLRMERLRLQDGHFSIIVQDGSDVTVGDVVSRSGFYLAAPGSRIRIRHADLGVGCFSDSFNRIIFPGDTRFEHCRFILRPELGAKPCESEKWAAIHLYWNLSSTAYRPQSLTFTDCRFDVGHEVPRHAITYAVYVERQAVADEEGVLSLIDSTVSRRYAFGLWVKGGGKLFVQKSHIGAKTSFQLEP